jgi:hypothetical protein
MSSLSHALYPAICTKFDQFLRWPQGISPTRCKGVDFFLVTLWLCVFNNHPLRVRNFKQIPLLAKLPGFQIFLLR